MSDELWTEISARLAALGAAAMVDAYPQAALAGPRIRPVWTPVSLAGPAFTVETEPHDNRALHRAIAEAPPGAVLAVAAGGTLKAAIIGDVLSKVALARGIAGLVTDGAARDTDRIRELRFPVFCAGITPAPPAKSAWGEIGVRIRVGDAEISAGDWIVGDGDGVVVIPAAALGDMLERAARLARREKDLVRRAIAGETTLDQLGLRP
jgi:4-hydroxy-4-methyl-2-oxoglutarate aldolase